MKLPNLKNAFQHIVGFAALFVASVAGFFSIAGIGMLFSGAYFSTVIMAVSLETGKVVATSFLYRYWNEITIALKAYLIVAVAVLMLITSVGVFGWLSSAYQASAAEFAASEQKTAALVEQKSVANAELAISKQRIDMIFGLRTDQEKRMNDALSNPALSRNPTQLRQYQDQTIDLIKKTDFDLTDEKAKYSTINSKVTDIGNQILQSTAESGKKKDIGTFKFVANAFKMPIDEIVRIYILIIIMVFDPLAVSLVLAYNVIIFANKKEEIAQILPPTAIIDTPVAVEPAIENTSPAPAPEPLKQPHGPFTRDHQILNK